MKARTSSGEPAADLFVQVGEAVGRAVAIAGSEVKLAAACGVTQPAISKAKLKGRVSSALALAIHRATNGRVPASELRPDLWRSPENVPITTGRAPAASPGG